MATLTGLIPVTVGTFEAYHGGGGGGVGGGYHWGGGLGTQSAGPSIYIYIYVGPNVHAVGGTLTFRGILSVHSDSRVTLSGDSWTHWMMQFLVAVEALGDGLW